MSGQTSTVSKSPNAAIEKKSDAKLEGGQKGLAPGYNLPISLPQIIANPQMARPDDILALQRCCGNRAVQRLFNSQTQRAGAVVQRETIKERMAKLAQGGLEDKSASAALFETDLAKIMTPTDNFAGRAKNKLGLGEEFTLKALTRNNLPVSGELRWKITSGANMDEATVDPKAGTIKAVANDKSGVVAKLYGGKGSKWEDAELITVAITVVVPTGATAEKQPVGASDPHMIEAKLILKYYLEPKDVSFSGLEWRECQDHIPATLTGNMGRVKVWADANGRPDVYQHHAAAPWWQIDGKDRNIVKNQVDNISNRFGLETSAGTFTWDIEWEYRIKGKDPATKIARTFPHVLTAEGDGDARPSSGTTTISKVEQKETTNWRTP